MTMRRDHPLDDEERKLAAQLARIAPHGEPSADLDARILAMAERDLAGISPTAIRPRKPQRWPVWLGAAASLTVVAGLVWQLQPVLQPRETISYEAPASVSADIDPNGKRQPIDYVGPAAADATMPASPPPIEAVSEAQPMQPRGAGPDPVSDAPVASVAPPPPAPPAPALPSAVANAAAQADAAAAAKSMAADRTMAQEAPRRPAPVSVEGAPNAAAMSAPAATSVPTAARTRQPTAASMQAQDAMVIESAPPPEADRAGFDARPPITADTPEVQRAWLKRIRELRDAGDTDEARQSLAAFAKRNPKAEIPSDLKPLLPVPATPSTQP